MRKIEKQMIAAIYSGNPMHNGNTVVSHDPVIGGTEAEVRLHGHLIAKVFHDDTVGISLCGYDTVTTRSRLRAIIRHAAEKLAEKRGPLRDPAADAAGPFRYPAGLGVSSRKGVIRLHDARGETVIDDTGWHHVHL